MFLWVLHWRHNDHDGVSNHQPQDCLLNHLFRRRSKKTSKLPRHWPLCGELTGTGEFPAQRASYAENVSIWWRHHGLTHCDLIAPYNFLIKKLLIYRRHSSLVRYWLGTLSFLKLMACHLKDPISWYQEWSIPPYLESDYMQQKFWQNALKKLLLMLLSWFWEGWVHYIWDRLANE